jgi:hypothetical protein
MLITFLDQHTLYDRLGGREFFGSETRAIYESSNLSLKGSPAPLHAPLGKVDFFLENREGGYVAEMRIIAQSRKPFGGLSELLSEMWGENWIELNENGVGFLNFQGRKSEDGTRFLVPAQNQLISIHGDIVGTDQFPYYHYITLGDAGAVPRRYGNRAQFDSDLEVFGFVAGKFLRAVYQHNKVDNPSIDKLSYCFSLTDPIG